MPVKIAFWVQILISTGAQSVKCGRQQRGGGGAVRRMWHVAVGAASSSLFSCCCYCYLCHVIQTCSPTFAKMHSTVTNARHILQDELHTALSVLLLPRYCCCCGLCLSCCCWCCPTALNVMVHGLWTLSTRPLSFSFLFCLSFYHTLSPTAQRTHIKMKPQSEASQMRKLDQMCGRSTLDSGACISADSTFTSLLLVCLPLACFAAKRAQGPAKCNAESDLAI